MPGQARDGGEGAVRRRVPLRRALASVRHAAGARAPARLSQQRAAPVDPTDPVRTKPHADREEVGGPPQSSARSWRHWPMRAPRATTGRALLRRSRVCPARGDRDELVLAGSSFSAPRLENSWIVKSTLATARGAANVAVMAGAVRRGASPRAARRWRRARAADPRRDLRLLRGGERQRRPAEAHVEVPEERRGTRKACGHLGAAEAGSTSGIAARR